MPDIFISKPKKDVPQKELEEKLPVTKEMKLEKKKNNHETYKFNPLSSFIYHPRDVNFANKDSEEEIILILRKHQITNIKWMLIAVLMLFAPSVLSVFPLLDFLPERFKFIGVVIWYLITTAFVFEKFLTWYFNVNIITDERVFDVDFAHLTYREMTDANIDQIQDVTVRMGSVIRTVSNYGDVIIQTAAEIPQIEFTGIPQPDRVAKILRDLRVEEEEEKLEGRVR